MFFSSLLNPGCIAERAGNLSFSVAGVAAEFPFPIADKAFLRFSAQRGNAIGTSATVRNSVDADRAVVHFFPVANNARGRSGQPLQGRRPPLRDDLILLSIQFPRYPLGFLESLILLNSDGSHRGHKDHGKKAGHHPAQAARRKLRRRNTGRNLISLNLQGSRNRLRGDRRLWRSRLSNLLEALIAHLRSLPPLRNVEGLPATRTSPCCHLEIFPKLLTPAIPDYRTGFPPSNRQAAKPPRMAPERFGAMTA